MNDAEKAYFLEAVRKQTRVEEARDSTWLQWGQLGRELAKLCLSSFKTRGQALVGQAAKAAGLTQREMRDNLGLEVGRLAMRGKLRRRVGEKCNNGKRGQGLRLVLAVFPWPCPLFLGRVP